jgi:Icc protein
MTKIATHPKSSRVIKVLQITDMHLYAESSGKLLGLNTEASLEAVIAEIRAHHLPADAILATGDLVHDGKPAAYERIFSWLRDFGIPVYCLPGNHDEANTLKKSVNHRLIRYVEQVLIGNWQIIFLDSTIPDSEGAHLRPETLQALEAGLRAAPHNPTLVCLHHQPIAMGSRWLDTMAVDNPDEFFAIIDRYPQVRGILWGHVHQELDRMYKGIKMMSSPSTCIQFLPMSNEFAIDPIPPGYRWLELHPDGRIVSGVRRIEEIPGQIDMASVGY